MRKCNRMSCLWFLHSFDFSQYNKHSLDQWERVQHECESCPKDCIKYIEKQEIINWWENRKKEILL